MLRRAIGTSLTSIRALRHVSGPELALTSAGCSLLLVELVTGYAMLSGAGGNSLGRLGVLALALGPRVLLGTAGLVPVSFLARRFRAFVAARLLGFVAVLSAVIAVWPATLQYLHARREGVRPSLTAALIPRENENVTHPEKTVTYFTTPDGVKLVLDVWRATSVPDGRLRPAIVKVHGGAWIRGARGERSAWNAFFNELGYDVFDIEYRMPPPLRWLTEVGDVKCALGWVAANAAKYRIDVERISVMGHSAGANLAMLAAYSKGNPSLLPSCPAENVAVRSVINIYGPTDLKRLHATSGSPNPIRRALHQYVGGTPLELVNRYELLSPIRHVHKGTPPTLTLHGEIDRVVPMSQATLLDEELTEMHVRHETCLLPWADHGFDAVWDSVATQTARDKIKAFLARYG